MEKKNHKLIGVSKTLEETLTFQRVHNEGLKLGVSTAKGQS